MKKRLNTVPSGWDKRNMLTWLQGWACLVWGNRFHNIACINNSLQVNVWVLPLCTPLNYSTTCKYWSFYSLTFTYFTLTLLYCCINHSSTVNMTCRLLEFPKSNQMFSVFNVLKDLSDRIGVAALCSGSRWKSWVRLFFTSLAAVE